MEPDRAQIVEPDRAQKMEYPVLTEIFGEAYMQVGPFYATMGDKNARKMRPIKRRASKKADEKLRRKREVDKKGEKRGR